MQNMAAGFLVCVFAYGIGSLPFGYLTGQLIFGKDIRRHGSGNVGATNVGRVLGAKWGALVLLLDFLKGLLPVLLLPALISVSQTSVFGHMRVACGVAAIVGHMYPCWLDFRGGKGVATALGVISVVGGWATAVAIVVFAGCFGAFRIVSLSSMLAAVTFASCQMVRLWPDVFSSENWSLTAFSLAVPALIVYRHRANIGRLVRGEEKRFRAGSGDEFAK